MLGPLSTNIRGLEIREYIDTRYKPVLLQCDLNGEIPTT